MNINDNPNLLPTNREETDAFEQSLEAAELDHMEQMAPEDEDNEQDQFLSDAEADSDALASCGFGTNEDYGGDHDCGGDW